MVWRSLKVSFHCVRQSHRTRCLFCYSSYVQFWCCHHGETAPLQAQSGDTDSLFGSQTGTDSARQSHLRKRLRYPSQWCVVLVFSSVFAGCFWEFFFSEILTHSLTHSITPSSSSSLDRLTVDRRTLSLVHFNTLVFHHVVSYRLIRSQGLHNSRAVRICGDLLVRLPGSVAH